MRRFLSVFAFVAITTILLSGPIYAQQVQVSEGDCQFGDLESPLTSGMQRDICEFIRGSGGRPLISYMSIVINFVTGMIIAIGLVTIVASGYVYMTAGGGDRIKLAKEMLVGALLGIALALSAYLILNTISGQFASDIQEPTLNFPPNQPAP